MARAFERIELFVCIQRLKIGVSAHLICGGFFISRRGTVFRRVLVPLDGSHLAEAVLPHVSAIAHVSEAQVYLLRVLDPLSSVTRPATVDPFDWQMHKAEAESYLREISTRLQAAGIRTSEEVLEGKAAETVVDYTHTHSIDLILLSSHGQSGISGWNVSSVVQKIILRAQTSILIIRAYQPPVEDPGDLHYRRIVAPLDGSQRAEIVLPVAVSLARFHQASLVIAHVVQRPELPRRTPPTQEDMDLVQKITERNQMEASLYLDEIKARMDISVDISVSTSESVRTALHQIVEQQGADLVILSAHGYSGETRWPYGSTVVSFIAYGTTPLLVVQDLPSNQIEPTQAELAAQMRGGR